jgi:hypothetical protein
MASIETVIKRLETEHTRLGTWRAVSRQIEQERGIHIPAGTLCYIHKQGGQYIPANRLYLAALGLKRKPSPRAPRSLFDLPAAALAQMFANRVEMP